MLGTDFMAEPGARSPLRASALRSVPLLQPRLSYPKAVVCVLPCLHALGCKASLLRSKESSREGAAVVVVPLLHGAPYTDITSTVKVSAAVHDVCVWMLGSHTPFRPPSFLSFCWYIASGKHSSWYAAGIDGVIQRSTGGEELPTEAAVVERSLFSLRFHRLSRFQARLAPEDSTELLLHQTHTQLLLKLLSY